MVVHQVIIYFRLLVILFENIKLLMVLQNKQVEAMKPITNKAIKYSILPKTIYIYILGPSSTQL